MLTPGRRGRSIRREMFFSLPQGAPSLVGETVEIDNTQKSPESSGGGNCGAPSHCWNGGEGA